MPDNLHQEWIKLLSSLANNQPQYLEEWRDLPPIKRKKEFRKAFGEAGDILRWNGYGLIKLGPLTRVAIKRFAVKLGRALYYIHIGKIFEGEISFTHVDPLMKNRDPEHLRVMLELAPQFVHPRRCGRFLDHQFIYRLNFNVELGALYAVVEFGPQMVFQIMALRSDIARKINEELSTAGITAPPGAVSHCVLAAN